MKNNTELVEILEKKVLEETKNGNKELADKYQELIIDIYKTIEKDMEELSK